MLKEDIREFLTANGFSCICGDICGHGMLRTETKDGRERIILPVEIDAESPEEARKHADGIRTVIESITEISGQRPVIMTADRWKQQRNMMEKRLLAHLEVFFPIYARNCEIRRIDKAEAAAFLHESHSYGDASCRYRYGLFLKRHTGKRASDMSYGSSRNGNEENLHKGMKFIETGTLVAVSEFSNARKWKKGDKVIRSYEWTRYASLPDVRINGGMGKILNHFIKEVQPDDIMSYADLEWSEGRAYEQLGFILEGQKEAVTFMVDMERGVRTPLGKISCADVQDDNYNISGIQDGRNNIPDTSDDREAVRYNRYFRNLGSNKYRLKLTDYK